MKSRQVKLVKRIQLPPAGPALKYRMNNLDLFDPCRHVVPKSFQLISGTVFGTNNRDNLSFWRSLCSLETTTIIQPISAKTEQRPVAALSHWVDVVETTLIIISQGPFTLLSSSVSGKCSTQLCRAFQCQEMLLTLAVLWELYLCAQFRFQAPTGD